MAVVIALNVTFLNCNAKNTQLLQAPPDLPKTLPEWGRMWPICNKKLTFNEKYYDHF